MFLNTYIFIDGKGVVIYLLTFTTNCIDSSLLRVFFIKITKKSISYDITLTCTCTIFLLRWFICLQCVVLYCSCKRMQAFPSILLSPIWYGGSWNQPNFTRKYFLNLKMCSCIHFRRSDVLLRSLKHLFFYKNKLYRNTELWHLKYFEQVENISKLLQVSLYPLGSYKFCTSSTWTLASWCVKNILSLQRRGLRPSNGFRIVQYCIFIKKKKVHCDYNNVLLTLHCVLLQQWRCWNSGKAKCKHLWETGYGKI